MVSDHRDLDERRICDFSIDSVHEIVSGVPSKTGVTTDFSALLLSYSVTTSIHLLTNTCLLEQLTARQAYCGHVQSMSSTFIYSDSVPVRMLEH